MPNPLGNQRIWDPTTNTIQDEFGNVIGSAGEQSASPPGLLSSPGQEPPTPSQPPIPNDPRGFVKDLLSSGLQIAGGLVPGGLALRTAIAAATGGGSALIEGENPIDGMLANTALEGGFGTAAHVIPRLGNQLALLTGGVGKMSAGERADALKAFMSQRDRFFGGTRPDGRSPTFRDALAHPSRTIDDISERGLSTTPPVGSWRSAKLRKKVGERLEGIETATPGQIDWGPEAAKAVDPLLDAAKGAEDPVAYIRSIIDNESRYLRGQQVVRGGKTTESVRDVMEMGRQESARGKEIFSQRKKGEFIPADDVLHAKINAARGSGLKDAALAEADKTTLPGHSRSQGARIRSTNDEFSDLSQMAGATAKMRGGTLFAGGRAGMGYGLGMAGERLGGVPNLSSILGLLFTAATPSNLSRFANIAGRAAEVGPTLERARRLRRRKPRDDDKD